MEDENEMMNELQSISGAFQNRVFKVGSFLPEAASNRCSLRIRTRFAQPTVHVRKRANVTIRFFIHLYDNHGSLCSRFY